MRRFHEKRNRSVVDEFYLHMRLKHAGLGLEAALAKFAREILIQRAGAFGWRGGSFAMMHTGDALSVASA